MDVFTILVVDDHPHIRSWLVEFLALHFPDCRFLEAADGETAVEMAQNEKPHAVIMDLRLPGVNGFEATARIKREHPDAEVLVHSMDASPAVRRAAFAAGASAFLPKGEPPHRLTRVVRKLLSRASQARA